MILFRVLVFASLITPWCCQALPASNISGNDKTASQSESLVADSVAMRYPAFSSTEIQFKGDILPFESYQKWWQQVKEKARSGRELNGFGRYVNPVLYDQLREGVEAQWIEYQSQGLKISGAMLFPVNNESVNKFPVLIYNRGGNAKTPLTRRFIAKTLLPFAAKGYLVLASNYRGSRFSEGQDEFGGADVNDVLRLVELVKTIPAADPKRIAMMGSSRGAQMTYQVLRKNHRDIKVAIAIAGVSDHFSEVVRRPEMEQNIFNLYVPEFKTNRQQALEQRSALFWADEISPKTPLLLLHGTADWRVNSDNSVKLAAKLEALGRPYKLVEYPNGDHFLTFYQQQSWQEIWHWLDTYLD